MSHRGGHHGVELQERTHADDHDGDHELDQRRDDAHQVLRNNHLYDDVTKALDPGEQNQLAAGVQAEAAVLTTVATAQQHLADAAKLAGQSNPDPRRSRKACVIVSVLLGGTGLPTGIILLALYLAGVFNAARQAENQTTGTPTPTPTPNPTPTPSPVPNPTPTPTPTTPGKLDDLYAKVDEALRKADEQPFWDSYKAVIKQFDAGLDVQALAAAHLLMIDAPGFTAAHMTTPFFQSQAYRTEARSIADQVLDKANADPLLHYDLVHGTGMKKLALGIKTIDDNPRALRLGLLLVVLDELTKRVATKPGS